MPAILSILRSRSSPPMAYQMTIQPNQEPGAMNHLSRLVLFIGEISAGKHRELTTKPEIQKVLFHLY